MKYPHNCSLKHPQDQDVAALVPIPSKEHTMGFCGLKHLSSGINFERKKYLIGHGKLFNSTFLDLKQNCNKMNVTNKKKKAANNMFNI